MDEILNLYKRDANGSSDTWYMSRNTSYNVTNDTAAFNNNMYDDFDRSEIAEYLEFEKYVRIVIPIIFGMIVFLGLVGNLLVIVVVLSNQQMRSTTNILILSLAFADLFFIVFCVPFTATGYVSTTWPFANNWCKIVQYLTYVCAYASVYTLVLMSLDRYLAVVHPISSMSFRTQRNTYIMVMAVWVIIVAANSPLILHFGVVDYGYYGEARSACLFKEGLDDPHLAKTFYGCFFVFGYILPLSLVCVLYGFMLKRLLYGVVPGGSHRAESIRTKKRVTKMVVIVVVIFALCWLPIQIIFMVQNFGKFSEEILTVAAQMAANCLAYMNSCVNPILYAFLSENFRRSFRKLLCCGAGQYTKFEYERTNVKNVEREKENQKSLSQSTACTTTTNTTLMQTFYNNCNNSNNCGVEAVNHCQHSEV